MTLVLDALRELAVLDAQLIKLCRSRLCSLAPPCEVVLDNLCLTVRADRDWTNALAQGGGIVQRYSAERVVGAAVEVVPVVHHRCRCLLKVGVGWFHTSETSRPGRPVCQNLAAFLGGTRAIASPRTRLEPAQALPANCTLTTSCVGMKLVAGTPSAREDFLLCRGEQRLPRPIIATAEDAKNSAAQAAAAIQGVSGRSRPK
jgi:hypothetical protein